MGKRAGLFAGMGVFLATSQALAAPAFTAEAIHVPPGQSSEMGRVFISEQGSRFEFERKGRPVVQIVLPKQGVVRLLFPQDKTYVEMTQQSQAELAKQITPCPPAAVAQCERTAMEVMNGRPVEVWRITFNSTPSAQVPSTPAANQESVASNSIQIWWDAERKLALREQYPDGGSSATVLRGLINHQGRAVEHWQITFTSADGKTVQMLRWYDPELQTDVREEYPNGALREFRNIHLVTPDPIWFAVPADYRRVDPQMMRNEEPQHSIESGRNKAPLEISPQPERKMYSPGDAADGYPPEER